MNLIQKSFSEKLVSEVMQEQFPIVDESIPSMQLHSCSNTPKPF